MFASRAKVGHPNGPSRQTVRAYYFLLMPFEQLSDTIKRSIERGTDTIARAARRGAFVGAFVGAWTGLGLISIGYLIGSHM